VETDAQLIAHDDHRIWHDRLTGRRRLEEEAQQTMNTFEESNKCYHHTAELHKTMRVTSKVETRQVARESVGDRTNDIHKIFIPCRRRYLIGSYI
jgi:hypothetical protein